MNKPDIRILSAREFAALKTVNVSAEAISKQLRKGHSFVGILEKKKIGYTWMLTVDINKASGEIIKAKD